jgi:hypothetical protein
MARRTIFEKTNLEKTNLEKTTPAVGLMMRARRSGDDVASTIVPASRKTRTSPGTTWKLFCFEQTFSSPLNSLIADESEGLQMNRRGVEFSLTQVEPGLWKWQFQIGDIVTIGKTQSNLMGMAARRVQQRIDRELGKPRDLAACKVEQRPPP